MQISDGIAGRDLNVKTMHTIQVLQKALIDGSTRQLKEEVKLTS